MYRGPQSAQSVPKGHAALMEPTPPSWQVPVKALPSRSLHVLLHHIGGGDGGGKNGGGGNGHGGGGA